MPKLFEETLGLKLAIVTGYPGGGEVDLAIEKGEVQCNSTSLSVFFGREPFHTWRKKNFVRVLIQTGNRRDPRLADVPTIYELMDQYKTPEASRRLTDGISRRRTLRFLADRRVRRGLPAERVKIFREAFVEALNDPALLAEAAKKQLEVEPIRGEELESLAKEVMAQPREVVERMKDLLGQLTTMP